MIFWIFQTGEPLPSDKIKPRKMRAYNLADTLIKKGHEVVIWSSAFNHQDKIHRCKKIKEINVNKNLIVKLIPSPLPYTHQHLHPPPYPLHSLFRDA